MYDANDESVFDIRFLTKTEIMDAVRDNIAGILDLDDATMTRLLNRLTELGVESVADLVELTVKDLVISSDHPGGVLLPVPARRLVRFWSNSNECAAQITGSPSLPSTSRVVGLPTAVAPPSTPPSPTARPLVDINWHQKFDTDACIRVMRDDESVAVQQAAKDLTSGSRLSSSSRNEVVRIVTDCILKHCRKPDRNQLNVVSSTIVQRFDLLKDNIDGFQLGCGYISLRNQLENRVAYLNRPVSAKKRSMCTKRAITEENDREVEKWKEEAENA